MSQAMRTAIVTGANGGLGRALVSALGEAGYFQILCGHRNVLDVSLRSETYITCRADLATPRGVADLEHTFGASQVNTLDLLVNCAAITHRLAPADTLTALEVNDVFAINVFSLFQMASWVIPIMRHQGHGVMVNVSSYGGRRAVPNLSAYCSSKFAVRGFTEGLAKELDGTGVKCISMSPGGINTKMRAYLFGEEDAAGQMEPTVVVNTIMDAVEGRLEVPNGADVVIRRGQVRVIPPEE